jgi:hypothetical protein
MSSKEGNHWNNIPNNREALAKMLGATETPVFNTEDAKNLDQFKSTISAVNRAEGLLANGHTPLVVEVGLGGQTTKSSLNEQHVSRMKHAAFDLYADHLRPTPKLKQEAETIVQKEQQVVRDRQAQLPEVQKLNTIWELPTYKTVGKDVDDEERNVR